MTVRGIHHVTAVSASIVENLEFYTGVLGLRLVKKSINQDDVKAYHLFYADTVASPGTDLTFFDWPDTPPAEAGPGTIALTTLRSRGGAALNYWEGRLEEAGVIAEREEDQRGRDSLRFSDMEGQRLEIIDDTGLPGEVVPWTAVVPEEYALRGILGVDLASARPKMTKRVLEEVLGFQVAAEGDTFEVLEVRDSDAVGEVRLVSGGTARFGRVGYGGVHHVAFRVKDDEELMAFKEKVEKIGLQTSGYVDRHYFHSLYFREPGGVLFELATDGPGMQMDEDPSALGEKLSIPPFLEHRRAEIEAGLKPIPAPAYLKR